MKTSGVFFAVMSLVMMTPAAAYADCKGVCGQYCGQTHPSNPSAKAVCYDGCMVGCVTGPTETTVEREG